MDSNTYLGVGNRDVLANRLDRVGAPSCYILHVRTVSIVYDMSDIYTFLRVGYLMPVSDIVPIAQSQNTDWSSIIISIVSGEVVRLSLHKMS